MPNLRDRDKYRDAAWDWAFLSPAFAPEPVRPCDGDGIVEQWGHLLLIEAKPTGYCYSTGDAQRRAHRVFSSRPGQVSLWLYGDKPEAPVVRQAQTSCLGTFEVKVDCGNTAVLIWVAEWFNHARSGCDASTCTWSSTLSALCT